MTIKVENKTPLMMGCREKRKNVHGISLFQELLKTPISLHTEENDVTLIITIKCKDGVVIQSDTKITKAKHIETKGKLFTILKTHNQNIKLLLVNRVDWFEETYTLLRKKFEGKENLTEDTIREILVECRNKQNQDLNNELKSDEKDPIEEKKKLDFNWPFAGIVISRITNNGKTNYYIHTYDLQQSPHTIYEQLVKINETIWQLYLYEQDDAIFYSHLFNKIDERVNNDKKRRLKENEQ